MFVCFFWMTLSFIFSSLTFRYAHVWNMPLPRWILLGYVWTMSESHQATSFQATSLWVWILKETIWQSLNIQTEEQCIIPSYCLILCNLFLNMHRDIPRLYIILCFYKEKLNTVQQLNELILFSISVFLRAHWWLVCISILKNITNHNNLFLYTILNIFSDFERIYQS